MDQKGNGEGSGMRFNCLHFAQYFFIVYKIAVLAEKPCGQKGGEGKTCETVLQPNFKGEAAIQQIWKKQGKCTKISTSE